MESCFSVKQQDKKSPVDDTMNRWSPVEKYTGRNSEIILGPYRSISKPDPEYDPDVNKGKDPGALNYIFRHSQTTTDEKYYLLQCTTEDDTAFMSYGLKYTFTEDKPAIISLPKTWKTKIINESYVINGKIRTTLNDNVWHFRIGPYAIALKSKSDSSYYNNVSGYVGRQGDSKKGDTSDAFKKSNLKNLENPGSQKLYPVYNTVSFDKSFDVIPTSRYHSPLFRESGNNPAGISFLESSRCIAIMTFSNNVSVLIKKSAATEYRLVLAAICSAMYELRGAD